MRALFVFLISSLFLFPGLALAANDLFLDEQWYLERIGAVDLESGPEQVIVAVLDAGFDLNHEDLAQQYWVNKQEIAGDGIDNDANGYEDDVFGWDFVDSDPNPSPDVSNPLTDNIISHGTLMSGIIAAQSGNGLGIAGIAPNAKIMPLRILDGTGAGSTAAVRHAIEYAVNNGASVINLSFTSSVPDIRLHETIRWAHEQGVVVVTAVGNENTDTSESPVFPACVDQLLGQQLVIGVAASNREDRKTDFSNFGDCVDVSAPGVNVFGAVYNDPTELLFSTSYGGPWEGTSVAAPMVSGTVALLKSHYPSLTPDQVRQVIKLSVDPIQESSAEARALLGAGRLNTKSALHVAGVFATGPRRASTPSQTVSSESFVVAQGRGSEPVVRRMRSDGSVAAEFMAYNPEFTGGVHVAMGDVNGDGELEIVTGAARGGGPQVRVFDLNGNVKDQFFAFDEGDRGGIDVAVGDVNADGIDEILVTSQTDGNGQVRIFNTRGHLKGAFFPFGRTANRLLLSTGNVDDDAADEMLISQAVVGDTRLRMFDGNGQYIRELSSLAKTAKGYTAVVSDLDTDGTEEIIVAPANQSDPIIMVYNRTGQLQTSFAVYDPGYRGGVHVGVADIDGSGTKEIYTAPRNGGGPHVRFFDPSGTVLGGFFVFEETDRFGLSLGI